MADINNRKDMIVLAIHTGKIYSVVEVVNNTSAESPVDGNTDNASSKYMTFSDYFNKKYGIPLMYPGQPLLRLKQSHNPHNLLVNDEEGCWCWLFLRNYCCCHQMGVKGWPWSCGMLI